MDRRVPTTGSEEIELYMRTYYSLLRSSDSIKIETLVESHLAMASSLHDRAVAIEPDASALMYSALRLPACIIQAEEILIGQMEARLYRRRLQKCGRLAAGVCAGPPPPHPFQWG